jgi:transketolase
VINFSTIKPLDETTLLRIGKEISRVVTLEDHQKMGGFGSAVSEFYSQVMPIPMEILGVNDQFGQTGEGEELLEYYGLGAKDVIAAAKRILNR